MLEIGMPLLSFYSQGWTPLHYAANFGKFQVSNYLIEKGADVNAVDRR